MSKKVLSGGPLLTLAVALIAFGAGLHPTPVAAQGGWGGFGGGFEAAKPGQRLIPAQAQRYPSTTALYDPTALRTLFLQFPNADWESQLAAAKYSDVDLPATVTVDGKTYANVGAQFRGNSSFRQVDAGSKRSLNLSFDATDEKQRLLGYRTLNLLNSMGDATFVRTSLYSHIARDYIAAPKVNYVRVAINGEDWGVYVNVQQFNKDMLRESYGGDGEGERWKVPGNPRGGAGLTYLGEDAAAYRSMYEIKTKDSVSAWAKLIELTRVLDRTPSDQLEAALAPILDIDETLKFLALEVVLGNTDGYWSRGSDLNLYRDAKGRFHVIPHDFNEGLAGDSQLDPLVAVDDSGKPLRSKLLAVPALRSRYLGYVRAIADKWLDWRRLGPIARQEQALIADEVAVDTRKLHSTAAFHSGVTELQAWAEARRTYLLAYAPPQ